MDKGTILIVDDSSVNVEILREYFNSTNYQVLYCFNGKAALSIAEEQCPDLILLDVMMPDMNGFETCRHLKTNETTKDIPVIFMTALQEISDKVSGFKAGAVDFITKPFDNGEVLARVSTHLTLKKLREDLEAKNKELGEVLSLKENVIKMVSHEVRRPLNQMSMLISIMNKYPDAIPPDKLKVYCGDIDVGIKQVTSMLDELLIISRSESGELSPRPLKFDFEATLADVITEFQQVNGITRDIILEYHAASPLIIADEKLLYHVFSNLISNAVKYSSNHTKVICRTYDKHEFIIVEVIDFGIGIPKADLPRLFKEFKRAENVGEIKGTGLGLSIVHTFMKAQQGTIEVVSTEGEGTTFIASIPHDIRKSPIKTELLYNQ